MNKEDIKERAKVCATFYKNANFETANIYIEDTINIIESNTDIELYERNVLIVYFQNLISFYLTTFK